jgi:hypothetical protein
MTGPKVKVRVPQERRLPSRRFFGWLCGSLMLIQLQVLAADAATQLNEQRERAGSGPRS